MDSPQSETGAPKRHSDKAPRQGEFIRAQYQQRDSHGGDHRRGGADQDLYRAKLLYPLSASMERTLMTGDRHHC